MPLPDVISRKAAAITAIRNAYEHIEDRALGQKRGKPDQSALSIFDHAELVTHGNIVCEGHELGLDEDVPEILLAVREFLKRVAAHEEARSKRE